MSTVEQGRGCSTSDRWRNTMRYHQRPQTAWSCHSTPTGRLLHCQCGILTGSPASFFHLLSRKGFKCHCQWCGGHSDCQPECVGSQTPGRRVLQLEVLKFKNSLHSAHSDSSSDSGRSSKKVVHVPHGIKRYPLYLKTSVPGLQLIDSSSLDKIPGSPRRPADSRCWHCSAVMSGVQGAAEPLFEFWDGYSSDRCQNYRSNMRF